MSLPRPTWLVIPVIAIAASVGSSSVVAESLKDAKRIATIRPAEGFVDTPLALDATGKRLAYVTTNAADKSQLHVYDLDRAEEISSFGIESLKATPVAVSFVGDQLFVVGKARGREVGVVYDQSGTIARKIGKAQRVRATTYKGRQVASLYTARNTAAGGQHRVEAIDLLTGKRVGRRFSLSVQSTGLDKKRRFVLNHWESEHLIAVGKVIGTYNRKADQRMPDQAGRFDMPAGKIGERAQIKDLIAHRRYLEAFAKRPSDERFVAISRDRRSLQRFDSRSLKPVNVTLAEPFNHYDPASLRSIRGAGGSVFFTFTIDPVHPAAAAAKRAVPDWLDLYELPAGATRAIRRARWLVDKQRNIHWVASSRHLIVIPKHVGFSRGGPELSIFRFETGSSPTTSKK